MSRRDDPGRFTVPTAGGVRELAFRRLDDLIIGEIERARPRVRQLRKRYPDAPEAELVRQLVDRKKAYAGSGGALTGLFGLVAIPADLVLVTYLQIAVIVEIAILYRVNLKTRRGQQEVLEILGRGNGVGPLVRSGPPILARLVVSIVRRKGVPLVGRAVPLVAAPVNAWLNNRDIERVGEQARLHYEGLRRLDARRKVGA